MLKCCGRLVRPKRYSFTDQDGLHVLKVGTCSNSNCGAFLLEIEKVSIFGRTEKNVLRGKRALRFLEENKQRIREEKNFRQYKENTAKGFHYSNTFWDLKRNKIRQEVRELATDRLISREESDLIAV